MKIIPKLTEVEKEVLKLVSSSNNLFLIGLNSEYHIMCIPLIKKGILTVNHSFGNFINISKICPK